MLTKVIYKVDDFGRVKVEQYSQQRINGKIILDYSEAFETVSQQAHHHEAKVYVEIPEKEEQEPDSNDIPIAEGTIVEIAESTESNDLNDGSEKELLTEDEKKGNDAWSFGMISTDISLLTPKVVIANTMKLSCYSVE
jgi:hypothetical protein